MAQPASQFALQTPSLPAPVFVTYSLHRVGNNGVCSLRFEELQYSLNSRKGNYFQHNLSWFWIVNQGKDTGRVQAVEALVGCSPRVEAVLVCPPGLLTPPSEGPSRTPKTANLRHRNGDVSFLDVFPSTNSLYGAEWLSAPVPPAAPSWGTGGKNQRRVRSKRLLQGDRHHHVGCPPCWKHRLARLSPRFTASSSQEHGDVTLGSSGDRGFQLDVCRFFLSLLHFTIMNLDQNQCKARNTTSYSSVKDHDRVLHSHCLLNPMLQSYDTSKVDDQQKIFLQARKLGAGISRKESFGKNYPLLFCSSKVSSYPWSLWIWVFHSLNYLSS